MGFFKGSQSNKMDAKSIFQQLFHGCQHLKVFNTSGLNVSKTLDVFKKTLKYIVLYNSRSIYHQQSSDIPPTFMLVDMSPIYQST